MSKDVIGFALAGINTEQFATIDSVNINEDEISIGVDFDFGMNEEKQMLACFFKVQYFSEKEPFMILAVSCEFDVEPKAWASFVDEGKENIVFPMGFVKHLAMITVGTARGVLHAKTEKTDYNKFFLFTVNVEELITEDIDFKLSTI